MSYVVLIVLVVAVVGSFLWLRAGTTPGSEARELVRGGALLVDVRTPQEFAQGHIEGARNIPVGELPTRLSELGEKHSAIVLYCRSGARSAKAKALLESSGYTSVANLGGMSRWPE